MTDPKRQPLPWFAFNVGEYIKDTLRLSTEAHGAYLLLMLDYYGTASPCPDDDFVLAAVAKLPAERWAQIRKVLEPFFDIREGHWFHKRIEREMQEACSRHSDRTAQAQAAASARWDKARAAKQAEPEKPARTPAKRRKPAESIPVSNAPSMRTALPEQCSDDAQRQKHPSLTEGGESPTPEGDETDFGMGTPVPRDFTPDPATSDRARATGMEIAEIDAEVRKFIGKHAADGTFSHDWQGSFAVWIEREIAHRARKPKAPPRIEVNNGRPEPSLADIQHALKLFATGAQWSRWLGPEPGQLGCRIDPKLIEAAGLDPKTGMPARKAS